MIRFCNDRYNPATAIRIVNMQQVYFYLKHGAMPIDIYAGFDNRVVVVFDRNATQELYNKWVAYENNYLISGIV